MRLQVVGWSHHKTPIELRERIAFDCAQAAEMLGQFRSQYPEFEFVLLSTCNRVELYCGAQVAHLPAGEQIQQAIAEFHGVDVSDLEPHAYVYQDKDAARHLFCVAAGLDSMVLGESQILGQVKQAYQLASRHNATGPITHAAFQTALRVARRIASETTIQQHRVSIPSVAVGDFARRIFERFDDKHAVVIGAGEMAEETLRYLKDEGVRDISVVNRNYGRACQLAVRWGGRALPWERLLEAIGRADIVISITSSQEPIVRAEQLAQLCSSRYERPLFILDLAVPRDFDSEVGNLPGVYLYSIDDLQEACQENRRRRDAQVPAAMRIIEEETERFMQEMYHRTTGPIIQRLRSGWEKPKEEELERLFRKLPYLDERARQEIRIAFDRLINKLLHPPLESLRDESRHGIPYALMDALSRLFRLRE